MKQYKYISNISEEELKTGVVHACFNEDGFRCILIKNAVEKTVISKYDTDNLGIKMNAVLSLNGMDYYFHIVTAKKNDLSSNSGFDLVYEYVFRKILEPIKDSELAELVLSIEEYFRITPEKNNRSLQIGVWGELFCIKWIYNHGYEGIIQKYHNNFFLKHDVEFTSNFRMEIKTSVDQKRIHHFRHDQLCRNDIDILVSSVLVEEAQQGTSLYALFLDILDLVSDIEDRFAINKAMKMCDVNQDNQGLSFAEEKAGDDIRFYRAKSLPMLSVEIPEGITKVEYNVDCALGAPLALSDLIAEFINL